MVKGGTVVKQCSFPGCEKRSKARGLCNGHYQQQKAGKRLTPLKKYEHMPVMDGQKVCSRCRVLKPVDKFYLKKTGHIQTWCKACLVENSAQNVARRRASADSKA